jgi:uncharacterized caspase-like protein
MDLKALRPMARMLVRFAAARIWVALLLIACSGNAWAERRIALVVGNSSYKAANLSLSNPKNDAQDVSAALNGLGFEVVTVLDASKRDMDLAMQRFARLAIGADSAVFFYAGHAVQYRGRNFLMPVDAELEDEISVQYQTVAVDDVRGALDRMNGVKIIFLDACRNNPLADRLNKSLAGASRAVAPTRGLARPDKVDGTVVAYATAADDVAQDGQGRNSPFTAALLKRLQEAGLEIELMLRRVSRDVSEQTGGKQRPETYVSLQSEYYLNQNDRIAWEQLRGRDDAAALRGFISQYPSSPHIAAARDRLGLLLERGFDRLTREDDERRALAAAAEQRRAEQEAARKREDDERPAKASGQQQAALPPPSQIVRFSEPIPFGPPPVNGQTIEKLATGVPLFAPIEGLEERLWKRNCGSCHQWNRQSLCEQGKTYVKTPALTLRHSHPYGGPFKVVLLEWAKTGCQ